MTPLKIFREAFYLMYGAYPKELRLSTVVLDNKLLDICKDYNVHLVIPKQISPWITYKEFLSIFPTTSIDYIKDM